tara:strand:+ start:2078 stop:3580 length:1503 start_codon:yes stop_codon:yes gene_type:complete
MATKRKSIIEEALLEAKSLEDALKANTKEMLASHMKQEIENIVESSLNEDEEELEIDVEGSDEEMEEMPAEAGDDSEESELMDLDVDLDALAGDGGEEVELDVAELPAELDMGDEEELDLTGASDEEVIAVFKKMSDEDEVEVVKDADGIHLTDNETGAEYYIKEGDEHYEESYDKMDEESDCMKEEAGCGKKYEGHDPMDEEEVMYEIELDEEQPYGGNKGDESKSRRDYMEEGKYGGNKGDESRSHRDYMEEGDDMKEGHYGGNKGDESRSHRDYMEEGDDMYEGKYGGNKGDESRSHRDYMEEDEEIVDLDVKEGDDAIEEDKLKRHQSTGYQRYSGAKAGSDQASPYGGVSESRKRRTPKNVQKVSESKIMKEYKELKSKNEEYKGALKVFKNKLNEVALFNTNLAYVNRLFTEHSTTKSEKMEILKRFDNAESIKESKSIYKSVKSELDSKSPITESVENKVNKTVKSSKSDLNESTAYVDPQITAIKDLMRKLS